VIAALADARGRLLQIRGTRPRPHLDDKVLTAWNGLMIAAFARAARVLDDGEVYLQRASEAAGFLFAHVWQPATRTLLRRYRGGHAAVDGYAEDYAYLTFGLLELFQASGDPQWLEWALALQQRQDELFWDPIDGGWFSTTGQDASVLLRLKEDYDGAEPAASSISVMNLLSLAHLLPERGFEEKISRTLAAFASRAASVGRAVPMMMAALSTYHQGMSQLVLVGNESDAMTRAMRDEIRRRYLPATIMVPSWHDGRDALATVLPWIEPMTNLSAAYLCRDFVCAAPVFTSEDLARQLDGHQ
jgi:uncharacterized protein YyaL (SSP411 family)